MKRIIAVAALLMFSIGAVTVAQQAKAYTCTTHCWGNSCTTTCF